MSKLFPYFGGKTLMAEKIMPFIPPHKCYIEPFSGSLSLLLEKPPSNVEIANDLNRDVVQFFEVLRDAGSYQPVLERLVWLCRNTPMARSLHRDVEKSFKKGTRIEDPIERAAMFFFLKVCSINSGHGWWHSKIDNKADEWQRHIDLLKWACQRLAHVQFECKDFEAIIKQYDSPDTFFYLDPPYIDLNVGDYYPDTPVFSDADHERLAVALNKIQGKAIVSYYSHPSLAERYPGPKWQTNKYSMGKSSSTVAAGDIPRQRGDELLLFNFEPYPLFAMQEQMGIGMDDSDYGGSSLQEEPFDMELPQSEDE
jgi:DNA adenine methylase